MLLDKSNEVEKRPYRSCSICHPKDLGQAHPERYLRDSFSKLTTETYFPIRHYPRPNIRFVVGVLVHGLDRSEAIEILTSLTVQVHRSFCTNAFHSNYQLVIRDYLLGRRIKKGSNYAKSSLGLGRV